MPRTPQSSQALDDNRTVQVDARSAAAAAAGKAAPSPEVAHFFACIREADAYIQGSIFAHVAKLATPFTQQFKTTARYRVPQNADIYDEADKLQGKCIRRYIGLRVMTCSLLAAYLACVVELCRGALPTELKPAMASLPDAICRPGIALGLGLGFYGLRWMFRRGFLNFYIKMPVGELAHLMSAKFSKIVSDTNIACGQIESRSDFGTGLGWGQRAWGWSTIALWRSIQSRVLDGYATTVFWKMQVTDTGTERVSRLIKGGLVLTAVFLLFYFSGNDTQRSWIAGREPIYLSGIFWLAAWYLMFVHWKQRVRRKFPLDFTILLGAYAVLALIWSWHGGGRECDLTVSLVGAVCVSWFWCGWIVFDERDDKELIQIFSGKLKIDEISVLNTSFYFNSIASRFQNLVEELIDAQRSPRGSSPGQSNGES